MPESREAAEKRAERLGFPKKNVYCLDGDNQCFIVPYGIETVEAKRVYAESRASGMSKEQSAKIAHSVEGKARKK